MTSGVEPRRGRVSEAQLAGLAACLTERDRQIALDCYEHRVLSTQQLERLHFTSPRAGRRRLRTLYELQVLDRFRPRVPVGQGSAPCHWVLGEAGAHIAAEEHGIERSKLRWRHATALAIAGSAKLTHHVAVNELFTRLAVEARNVGGALTEWYGERTLHELFDGTITPDSYGVIRLPGRSPIHLLAELDRGTEPTARLHEKAVRYARAIPRSALRDTQPLLILLAVPTPARAASARTALAGTAAPITVTVWSAASHRSVLAILTAAASTDAPPDRTNARGEQAFSREKGPAPAPTT